MTEAESASSVVSFSCCITCLRASPLFSFRPSLLRANCLMRVLSLYFSLSLISSSLVLGRATDPIVIARIFKRTNPLLSKGRETRRPSTFGKTIYVDQRALSQSSRITLQTIRPTRARSWRRRWVTRSKKAGRCSTSRWRRPNSKAS